MNPAVKKYYDALGPKTVEALKRRKFDAYYVSTKEEAKELALSLIPATDSVSSGGTASVDEIGLLPALKERGNVYVDRGPVREATDPAEKKRLLAELLTVDTYLMSTNALSADGQLINIDGTANRVAALCYGPEQVIMVVGMNKIAPDLDSAMLRARNVAAPANKQRFGGTTPCLTTGKCGDCLCDDCICNQIVITRRCRPAGRIKIILVGEELGF